MDNWAIVAERELRKRIARFYLFLEKEKDNVPGSDVIMDEFRKEFNIDVVSASEMKRIGG